MQYVLLYLSCDVLIHTYRHFTCNQKQNKEEIFNEPLTSALQKQFMTQSDVRILLNVENRVRRWLVVFDGLIVRCVQDEHKQNNGRSIAQSEEMLSGK